MSVSSLDVARAAGVSPATVSLVMNGRTKVSIAPATRQRVLEVAERLGYRPNQLARNLLRGSTGTIGLVLPSLASSFVAQIAEGIQGEAGNRSRGVILAHTRGDPEFETTQFELLLRQKVDGIVIVTGEKTLPVLDQRLDVLRRCQMPCVVVDDQSHAGKVDCVVSADCHGAQLSVRHLISLGHRRIAHLSAGTLTSSGRDRQHGYREAMHHAGLPIVDDRIVGTSYTGTASQEALAHLLRHPVRPTAIFAANDRHLAEGLPLFARHGLKVPTDIALVGYANYDFANYLGLTSVDQNPVEMGRVALRRLLQRIETPHLDLDVIETPVKLIVRTSCGTSGPPIYPLS